MVSSAIQRQILVDLDRLSPKLQRRALRLVQGLDTARPRGASVEDLLSLGGLLDRESAQEMREIIEEHCERVDPREW